MPTHFRKQTLTVAELFCKAQATTSAARVPHPLIALELRPTSFIKMPDYQKKTVAELTEILKGRSLPHSGKKADLIARLNEADKAAEPPHGRCQF